MNLFNKVCIYFWANKRRFPILHYKSVLHYPPSRRWSFVFVLHNVAKYLKDSDDFLELDDTNKEAELSQVTDAATLG